MRITNFHKPTLVAIGLASLGLLLFAPKPAVAANPTTINFQGKVVNSDGTNVSNGTYSFIFRIYNTASPTMTTSCTSTASCLWQETQSSVTVTNGVFQVELGSACALTSSSCNNSTGGPINFSSTSSLYLTLQFAGDTSGSNGGFMSPTIHITSVPFALQADNSSTLGGLSATNFVQLAQGLQTDSSTSNASIAINKTNASGTPNILTLQKSGKNTLVVDNSGTTILGQAGASGLNGTLTFNNSAGSNTVSFSLQADPGSSYTLLLPTTGPSTSQCLQTDSTTANQLKFGACAGGSSTLQNVYDAGSAGDQVIALSSTNDSIIIRNPSSSGSNSGTTPLYIDQLATGTQGGLTINLAADSSIAANTRTGLAITSGAVTEATANTGALVGADITVPGLTSNTSSSAVLNGYGLKVTTGNLTQANSATISESGIYINSSSTVISSGATNTTLNGIYVNQGGLTTGGGTSSAILNGISINLASQDGGTYRGINIAADAARSITGGNFTGINLDLNTNITATGRTITGIAIATPQDTAISNKTKTGLSITSGAITEVSASTGNYVGTDITIPSLTASTSSSAVLNGYGLRVNGGSASVNNSATLSENGITIITGGQTQTSGTLTQNGLAVDASVNNPTSGTLNGLKISNVTDPGAGLTSNALTIGTGWDKQVNGNGWSVDGSGNLTVAGCTGCGGGSSPFTSASGTITQTTSTDQLNLVEGQAGDYGLKVSTSVAPTVDLVQIVNGNASATDGVDGLALNWTSSNASGDALHIIPSFSSTTTGKTFNGLEFDAFSPTNTTGTDTVNGILIGTLTDPGSSITSSAINIGTGWDNSILGAGALKIATGGGGDLNLSPAGNVVVNGSGSTGLVITGATNDITVGDTNGALQISANGSGDIFLDVGGASQTSIATQHIGAAPTVDMLILSNNGNASTSSGISAVRLNWFVSNASDDAIRITQSYAGGATDNLTYNGLELDAFSPTNASGTDTVNGIKIGALTDPGGTISSTGLNIGTGWDTGISVSSTASAQSGVNVTGISISTPADATIGSSTKTGLSLSVGAITQTTAVSGTYNGLLLNAPGAIQTTSAAGTLNWNGLNLTTPNATVNFASSQIVNSGLNITSGTLTQSTNGFGFSYGINISGGTITANGTGASAYGINIDDPGIIASSTSSATVSGIGFDTKGLALTTATTQNIYGINQTSANGISTSTAAGTINYNSEALTIADATTLFAGSAINANGLKVNTGSITQSSGNGTVTENGIFVDTSSGTLDSGVFTGIKIGGVSDPGANVTSNALTIGTGWDKQVNGNGWSVDGSGNLTVTSCTGCGGGKLQTTYNAGTSSSDSVITLDTTRAGIVIKDNSGTPISGTLFQVQNNSSKNIITVDDSTNALVLGNAGASGVNGLLVFKNSTNSNTVSIVSGVTSGSGYTLTLPTGLPGSTQCLASNTSGTLSFTSCNGGGAFTVVLAPEYPSTVLEPSSSGNNVGTLTSDFCSGTSYFSVNTSICASTDQHHYFSWTAQATNDYDIWTQWQVPNDFTSWGSTPVSLYGQETTSSSDYATITVYKKGSGTACGTATDSSGGGSTWHSLNISSLSGCTSPVAGDILEIKVNVKVGVNNDFTRVGEITMSYNK